MASYLQQNFVFRPMTEGMQYLSKVESVDDSEVFRETRLMFFDLMRLRS